MQKFGLCLFKAVAVFSLFLFLFLSSPICVSAQTAEHSINSEAKQKKRWQFEGKIAESLRHYVGGSVERYSKIGAQNPIRYVNC